MAASQVLRGRTNFPVSLTRQAFTAVNCPQFQHQRVNLRPVIRTIPPQAVGKVSEPTRPLRMRLAKMSERAEIALRITPV